MMKYIILFCLLNFSFIFVNINSTENNNLRKLDDDDDDEKSDDIIILHLNDVHCGINDTIGYDGYVLYRKELQKEYKYIINVDVGDHIQGGTLGTLSDGNAIIEIMNKVGFDVVTLGNHEFDYGIEQLMNLKKSITSNYICANFCYSENGKTILDPYKIISIGGKKIAFIGVLTPLTFTKTYLSSIKDNNGNPVYDFLADDNKLYDTLQSYINKLKDGEESVNYVILLTHFGMEIEKYTSNNLISKLERVDAILDGHTHKIYSELIEDKEGNDIPIAQTGTKLQTIGKLIIKADDGSLNSEIIYEVPEPDADLKGKKVKRSLKDRWVDSEISDFLDKQWEKYSSEINQIIGHSNFDLILKPETSTDPYCRLRECTLGNIISDSLKDILNADLTILNGGAIRDSLKKGDITKGNVISVLPWFESVVIKKLSGQVIMDALEFGVSQLPKKSGGFPQVSGLSFYVNISIDSPVIIDNSGSFVDIIGKRRVFNVKVNGINLELNKIYKVCLLEFTSKGGDGYSMFEKFEIYNESTLTNTDHLSLYIENDLKGEIPEKYKELEGRINIINGTLINNKKRKKFSSSEILKKSIFVFIYLLLMV